MSTISGRVKEVKDALDKWYEATNRRQITLVTAGRSGVGKSTLIGNMLQLKGDAAPERRHGPSTTTTTEVKLYTSSVNGIEVRIIDTPGFAASDVSEAKIIAELQSESGGEADMLLYCVSLLPNSKIDEHDAKIIKLLKVAFGPDIWSHAILVLTFADYVIHDLEEGTTLNDLVTDYAMKFQLVLQRHCPSFSVCSIFSCEQEQIERDPSTIIALPAGRNPNQELIEGMRWDESIYTEVLKKCSPDVIPALLKVREPTSDCVMLALKIGHYIKVSGLVSLIGAKILAGSIAHTARAVVAGTGPGITAIGSPMFNEIVSGIHSLYEMKESLKNLVDEETQLKKLRKDMQQTDIDK